jgi:hypothetical protein
VLLPTGGVFLRRKDGTGPGAFNKYALCAESDYGMCFHVRVCIMRYLLWAGVLGGVMFACVVC